MRPLSNIYTYILYVNVKLRENPHNHLFKRGEYLLEFIYINLSRRIPQGIHREEYWVMIINNTTTLTDVTLIMRKNDLLHAI
jgi:hypothetical protein